MDLYAVFRGDMTTRANYFSKMMQCSAISPNEIRAKEGMAPFEGGDRYFLAMNNYSPLDRVDELIDAQVDKVEGQDSSMGKEPDDSPDSRDTEETPDPLTQAAISFLTRR